MKPLPELLLDAEAELPRAGEPAGAGAEARTEAEPVRAPQDRPEALGRAAESGEGLRAAYYVEDDPASYSSLKQHIKQIDLLFPEWLHVVTPDGNLTSYTSTTVRSRWWTTAGVHRRRPREQGRHDDREQRR